MSEGSESIRSGVVEKYREMYGFFSKIYTDILADQADDSYNALNRTVPILSKLIDDVAGDGKEIDKVIGEMEQSIRSDFEEPQEGASVADDQVRDDDSRSLMEIKAAMTEMLRRLKENFGRFIQACTVGLEKNASIDMNDVGAVIARHYVDEACSACKIPNHKIEDVVESCGDMCITVKDSSGRRFMVIVGDDMSFRGIYPVGGCGCGSYRHYHDMFRPALSAIGHTKPIGKNFIMLCRYPSSAVDDDGDVYDAYDVERKKPVIARIVVSGGKRTKSPSYSIVSEDPVMKVASSIDSMRSTIRDNARKIAEYPMVKINIPNSKYHGMAGTVDIDRMVHHNDHVEFPVMLKYDTGLKTELWVTDDDVVAYG